jgi:drug/metabolite transporter (DMT)-like permease
MPQLALLLTTLIWGATFPATKAVLEQIPPLSFLVLRFLTGALCAWAALAVMGVRLHRDQQTLRRSAIATIWLFCGYVLQTVGLQYTSASNSAFITTLYVIFVPLFLGRFQPRIWASAALALIGLWCLIDPTVVLNLGDLLTLVCAAAFAAHIVCLESYSRVGDPRSFFVWQLLMVTGVLVPMMWIESPGPNAFALTPVLLVGLAVTGIFATGAFAVQVWAQRQVAAQRVALIFSLEPAYAAWLAWYFLDEQLSALGWLGSALILSAVVIGALAPEVNKTVEATASSPVTS